MTNPSDCTTASPEAEMPPLRADGEARGWDTGDAYLLRDLVREHSTRLQRFIVKHIGNTSEAEDLAQQAFVEAARSYGSFRGESQLSSWLYGIALNLVRNYLSRAPERRHDFVSDSVLQDHPSADLSPERCCRNRWMSCPKTCGTSCSWWGWTTFPTKKPPRC
jgi:RNA polymerase sigma-70 factor (ECF subfamily)